MAHPQITWKEPLICVFLREHQLKVKSPAIRARGARPGFASFSEVRFFFSSKGILCYISGVSPSPSPSSEGRVSDTRSLCDAFGFSVVADLVHQLNNMGNL